MEAEGKAIIQQLLETFEKKRDIRENLALLVDTIHMLTGLSCSAFLMSRRNNQVWWDYLKGQEFKGGTLAAHQPYQLSLDNPIQEPCWVASGAYLKSYYPLDDEHLILMRIKRQVDAARMEPIIGVVKSALPAIAVLYGRQRCERTLREGECVRHMSDTILSVPDRNRALHLLAASISKSVYSERASVLAVSPDREMLTVRAVYGGVRRAEVASRPIRLGDGVAGWSLANGKPANIADVRQDPRFIVTTFDDIRSMLCVPVSDRGKPLGVICAVNKRCHDYDGVKPFPDDDEAFLTALSRNVCGIFQGR